MIIFVFCASSFEVQEKDEDISPFLINTDQGLQVIGPLYDLLMIIMFFNLELEMYIL